MLPAALLTALLLLGIIVFVVWRGLDYLHRHPELMTDDAPASYRGCHTTLDEVVARYKQIEHQVTPRTVAAWQSPNGRLYTVSYEGVKERRSSADQGVYSLHWSQIGGVGVRMQPRFIFPDERGGRVETAVTTGYSFHLLVVPVSGDTMDVLIPTTGSAEAINFVAHVIALAERMDRRVNVFGFDRPPAPTR